MQPTSPEATNENVLVIYCTPDAILYTDNGRLGAVITMKIEQTHKHYQSHDKCNVLVSENIT